MYDKGHGVPQDIVLAYKWLDVAAARTRGHEHDTYAWWPRDIAEWPPEAGEVLPRMASWLSG